MLRLGTREVSAEIIDESAGGYAVVVEENIRAEANQMFSLRTVDGWVEVEVKNVQYQQWTSLEQNDEPVTRTRTRLGLLRKRDLEVRKPEESIWRRLSLGGVRKLLNTMRPATQSFSRAAATVVGIALVALGLAWGLEQTQIVERRSKKELAPPAKIKEVSRPAAAKYVKQKLPRLPKLKLEIPLPGKVELPKLPIEQASEGVLRRLSRPEVLFEPRIVDRLVLSPAQLRELEAVYQRGMQAAEGDAIDAEQIAQRELEIARQSLQVLTESQQRSLLNLLADLHAAEGRKAAAESGSTVSETRTGDP